MNKLFKSGLAILMAVFTAICAFAQGPEQLQELPLDPAIRTGVLPNGMTYFIRHNETPKGQADFYIAQKVGSILEDDNQRGLAHFLEHMCFNGTKNFPEKGVINWLESIGVKFGWNLNAYTSVDETVYNISNVPVARQSVQDSCLLILHDWADALTLAPEEIDAERGVIHEEWRRSNAGQMRIITELLPVVYPNCKYGERLPIGTMDVVDNFPYQALIDYYEKWYRPDQQGIIVVGDIDVDYIEAKIKEIFSPIQMPENAAERTYEQVPDNEGTIYAIGHDPEMSMTVAMMMFKCDPIIPREMRNTQLYFPVSFMTRMVTSMLNQRLSDLAKDANCPFAMASIEIGDFFISKTKSALTLQVVPKGDDIQPALAAAYRELLRAVRGGFTISEYDRAKAELISRYQRLYDSRNNTETDSYSREIVRFFVDNEPMVGIELEKQIYDQMAQFLPIDAINQLLPELVTENNRVIVVMSPEKEGFPYATEEGLSTALTAVDAEDIEPYAEEVRTDPLIPALPAAGSIKSEQHNAQWDATEFVLSNGLRVIVKPTTFKENDIQFQAMAKGGYSVAPEALAPSIICLPYTGSQNGLGAYTNSDVEKYLMGKQVSVSLDIDSYNRTLQGSTVVADLPTMMELIYAYFTEYNLYPEDFNSIVSLLQSALANQENTPDFKFQSLINRTLYKAAAEQMVTTEILGKADCEATEAFVRQMLANSGDFTFVFVGNIDLEAFKPLMCQYLATLPVDKAAAVEFVNNPAYEAVAGTNTTVDQAEMSTPQTWAYISLQAKMPYSARNRAIASIAGQILSKRLLNKVREEMGATYSIGASCYMSRQLENNVVCRTMWPMSPELSNDVFAAVDEIIAAMAADVKEDELNPVKEFMVKEAIASLDENTDWCASIAATQLNGVDVFNGQAEMLNTITLDEVKAFWKEFLAQGNRQTIILNPVQ